jgi:hypothetical protein
MRTPEFNWRDTALEPRLGPIDARAAASIVILLYWRSWLSFSIAILVPLFFLIASRFRVTPLIFLRMIRSTLVGYHRSPKTKRRRLSIALPRVALAAAALMMSTVLSNPAFAEFRWEGPDEPTGYPAPAIVTAPMTSAPLPAPQSTTPTPTSAAPPSSFPPGFYAGTASTARSAEPAGAAANTVPSASGSNATRGPVSLAAPGRSAPGVSVSPASQTAGSASDVIQGFGNGVPIGVALRAIVPNSYALRIQPDIEKITISWRGGQPWKETLDRIVLNAGLSWRMAGLDVIVERSPGAGSSNSSAAAGTTPRPPAQPKVVADPHLSAMAGPAGIGTIKEPSEPPNKRRIDATNGNQLPRLVGRPLP